MHNRRLHRELGVRVQSHHGRCLAAKMAGNEADMASRLVASGAVPCYARFGAPPRAGRSMNYAEGTAEAGISVFCAWLSSDGTAAWYAASDSYSTALFGTSRPAWALEGATVVGTGSDGEPLVQGGKWRRVRNLRPLV